MSDATSSDSSVPAAISGDHLVFGQVHLTRTLILISAIVCALIFYYAARRINWPDEPGFRGSLGQPKVALGAFITAIFLLVACTFVATLMVGRRWFLAGLMAATAGLTTWSVRGGNMTEVLFNANNSGAGSAVFIQLIVELIVLFAVIGGLWNLIWTATGGTTPNASSISGPGADTQAEKMRKAWLVGMFGVAGFVWSRNSKTSVAATRDEEGRSTGSALLAQTAIMAALVLIFAVTPLKKQVLTSVFLSGVTATAIAEYFFADRKAGRWYWVAPLVVGVVGYVAGYISPAGLDTGDLQGVFAPLTRVLPLDYASMGCAGVLFGYWWMDADGQTIANESATTPLPSSTEGA